MAKSPDRPGAPRKPVRDPAKHSQKDPARPTRAKADREPVQPLGPALADLLNPAIGKGTAGVGAQTGLQPPPDNSFDRRADFSAAHRARKSTPKGFEEAPQKGYTPRAPPGEIDPDIAKSLGIEDDEQDIPLPNPPPQGGREQAAPSSGRFAVPTALASQHALERLLREGRPEFATQ